MSRTAMIFACAGLVVSSAAIVGCNEDKKEAPKAATVATKSLYERIGGKPAVTAVVEKFVARTAGNPKVNFFRKNIPGVTEVKPTDQSVVALKARLVEFISVAAGATDVKYTGKDMKTSHAGMKITTAEFNALAEDLSITLDEFKVPAKEKAELMAAAASTAKDIIEVK
jgi:hemoglobin